MRTRYVICALAVVGLIAGAVAASAGATDTSGAGVGGAGRTVREAATSANWSGYVAGGDTGSATQFSAVSGSWTEPSVTCSAGQGNSSFWVGLGGADQQSASLEQVGTEADCSSGGSASDFAWYELVPSAPVRLNLAISPGDHMTGKVTVNGTDVTVSLWDTTTGASVTKTLQMSNPDVSSAEWIAEAPSTCEGSNNCQTLPLADFGKVTFTNASATAGGHTGTISDPDWSSQAVQLDGGAGTGFVSARSTLGATPSGLSSDGSSFSVAWASAGASSATSASGGDPYGYGGGSPYGYGGAGSYGYGGGGAYGYGGGGAYGYGGGGAYGYGGGGAYGYGGGGAYGYGGAGSYGYGGYGPVGY